MFAFFYGVLFKPKTSNVYIKNTKFAQSYGRRLDTQSFQLYRGIPAGNYLLKVNNRNTKTRYEICSKLTIKIPKRRHRLTSLLPASSRQQRSMKNKWHEQLHYLNISVSVSPQFLGILWCHVWKITKNVCYSLIT